MAKAEDSGNLSTIENTFRILDSLEGADAMTLTELSDHLDLSTSTTYNYLKTLEQIEAIVKEGEEYSLGLRFYEFGCSVRRSMDILEVAQPVLEELAKQTEEVVWLIVEEHGKTVFLENASGERAVPTHASKGDRSYMHCQAAGKVILAYYSRAEVEEILDRHGMPERTPTTITDRDVLFEELAEIEKTGIGFNDEESITGLRAVAAPIFRDGEIVAAISIPGPAKRLTGETLETTIPERLQKATNELELKLEYMDK